MPTVTHKKEYQKKLVSDTYQISTACCAKFREMNSEWIVCPYCGEDITIEELTETTKEV